MTSLSLMRLLPAYGDFLLPLSFVKKTIHLLSCLRHLAMTGGHQNSHPMLSRNKGKGSQASGSPPVMGPVTQPKRRTRPSQPSSAWRGGRQVLWGQRPRSQPQDYGVSPRPHLLHDPPSVCGSTPSEAFDVVSCVVTSYNKCPVWEGSLAVIPERSSHQEPTMCQALCQALGHQGIKPLHGPWAH